MISVYHTDQGWCSSWNGTVTYHRDFRKRWMPLTGRQIIMQRLNKAIQTATTGDLQRAAMFLEGARKVRAGCTNQRALPGVLKPPHGKRKLMTQSRGSVVVVM